jgi:hypothetical protein
VAGIWKAAVPLLLVTAMRAHAAENYLLPPGEKVAGATQAEWSARWWQWAGSFDLSVSPVADTTGKLCASKQSGSVWFLAGTYETHRTIRQCTVPAGRYLFFPLINYVTLPTSEGSADCEFVTRHAARITDDVSSLVLDIDGVRSADLQQHRQATQPCFNLAALAEPPTEIFPSAANGYYVMLKPLPPGTHTLNFGGRLPGMTQAVTYTLVVK